MTDIQSALAQLRAEANLDRAATQADFYQTEREVLGIAIPRLTELAKEWRDAISLEERLELAQGLWESEIHEARVAACKLWVQARIRPDDSAVWEQIKSWLPDVDNWHIADQLGEAGARRMLADPSRVEELEAWASSPYMWIRRAVLDFTMPWTKMNNPKEADQDLREQVLVWAAGYCPDRKWPIQNALAIWLRDLSKHDPQMVRDFLDDHGEDMKPFARKEAARYLRD